MNFAEVQLLDMTYLVDAPVDAVRAVVEGTIARLEWQCDRFDPETDSLTSYGRDGDTLAEVTVRLRPIESGCELSFSGYSTERDQALGARLARTLCSAVIGGPQESEPPNAPTAQDRSLRLGDLCIFAIPLAAGVLSAAIAWSLTSNVLLCAEVFLAAASAVGFTFAALWGFFHGERVESFAVHSRDIPVLFGKRTLYSFDYTKPHRAEPTTYDQTIELVQAASFIGGGVAAVGVGLLVVMITAFGHL